jgi:hypothetical protein
MEVFVLGAGPTSKGKFEVAANTVSDSEQCLEDILADLRAGWNIFDEEVRLQGANISPLMHEDHNTLVGAALTISIEVPYDHSACYAPLDGVSQGSNTTSYQRRGVLLIKEVDGDPTVSSVRTIVVPDGSLTDDGGGQVTLDFATGPSTPEVQKLATGAPSSTFFSTPTIAQFDNWKPVNFTAWTVTGDLQVGVVLDPLDRFVQFSGLSSGQEIITNVTFTVYSDAPAAVVEYYFLELRLEGTGNSFFTDDVTTYQETVIPVPAGEPFAQQYTLQATYSVLIYPTVRVRLFHRSFLGNVRVRCDAYTILVA